MLVLASRGTGLEEHEADYLLPGKMYFTAKYANN